MPHRAQSSPSFQSFWVSVSGRDERRDIDDVERRTGGMRKETGELDWLEEGIMERAEVKGYCYLL